MEKEAHYSALKKSHAAKGPRLRTRSRLPKDRIHAPGTYMYQTYMQSVSKESEDFHVYHQTEGICINH